MRPHTQNQLFPENFWYVLALDQTNSKIQKLNPYLQFSRGFRIFREIGVLGPKNRKIFFCLRMAGNDQKQCVLTFFDDFWVYLLLLSSLKIFDFSWWPTFNSHEWGFYLRNRFRSDIIITLKVERTKPFWWILNDKLHVFIWIRLLFAFTCDPYNKKRYKRGSLQKQDSVWIKPVKVFHPSARNIRWEKHDIGIFWIEFFGY